MKKIFLLLVLAVMCVRVEAQQPDTSSLKRMEERIAKLSAEVQSLNLRINKLTYDKFMQIAQDSRYMIPVYQLEGINLHGYRQQDGLLRHLDSVARIKTARLENSFNRDSAYRAMVQTLSVKLTVKGGYGEAARGQLREIRARLLEEDSVCRQAQSEQSDALFASNLAACRFVLERFQQLGRLLPTEIIPYQLRESIEHEHDIVQLKRQRGVLWESLSFTTRKYCELKYGEDTTEYLKYIFED